MAKSKLIREDEVAPGVAEGLTQGVPLDVLKKEHQSAPKSRDSRDHMTDADAALFARRGVPFARFVGESDPHAVWTDGQTDRVQMDVHLTFTKQGMGLLREGRQCLRCHEPLEIPFPIQCPLCGYAVKERQIMDIAMEFEGEKHIGPSKPITTYMEKLEERTEKRKFIDRILAGGQGKIPKEWLQDKELFPNGPPPQLAR